MIRFRSCPVSRTARSICIAPTPACSRPCIRVNTSIGAAARSDCAGGGEGGDLSSAGALVRRGLAGATSETQTSTLISDAVRNKPVSRVGFVQSFGRSKAAGR
jgi:hypothetical protein